VNDADAGAGALGCGVVVGTGAAVGCGAAVGGVTVDVLSYVPTPVPSKIADPAATGCAPNCPTWHPAGIVLVKIAEPVAAVIVDPRTAELLSRQTNTIRQLADVPPVRFAYTVNSDPETTPTIDE
jgi:hypothetical protein